MRLAPLGEHVAVILSPSTPRPIEVPSLLFDIMYPVPRTPLRFIREPHRTSPPGHYIVHCFLHTTHERRIAPAPEGSGASLRGGKGAGGGRE